MRFIMIETIDGEEEAINPSYISNIALTNDASGTYVGLYMASGVFVRTKFTTIQHAIDYIQRAASVTLEAS